MLAIRVILAWPKSFVRCYGKNLNELFGLPSALDSKSQKIES